MTEYIKSKIHWKKCIYNKYMNSSRNRADYVILQQVISEVSELIEDTKNNYYDMSNPSTSSKTYCFILKHFAIIRKYL